MTFSRRKTIQLTLALAAVTLMASTACRNDEAAAAPHRGGGGRPPAAVQLATVEQGAFDVASRFVGRLRAQSSAELYARTDGPLTAVFAGSGDRVRRGQILARIDASDAVQRVEQARAALRMAEATWRQRLANLELARGNAQRSESLFGQQLLSESDYEIARAELSSAESQVELARAQVEQAKSNVNGAELELAKTRIIAPFDGFIGTRHLDLGAHATTNRPIFSIVDVATIRTTVAIPAHEAVHIRPGQSATVTADVLPGTPFTGRVARISSVVDPQTNTVEAEVEVPNADGALKPGMFGNVAITYRTTPDALLVPAEAVRRNEHEQWIFVVEKGEEGLTARRINVRVLDSADARSARVAVEPLAGSLAAGTRVIVLGHEALSDGAPVVAAGAASDSSREEAR